ncbi:MAG: ROK family protein [Acidobacteriota bacterium]
MQTYAIGIDLGGTNLRAAAFSTDGKLLRRVSGSTPVTAGPEAVISDMVHSAERLRTEFGRDGLAGIGAGVPGNIDMATGVVKGWNNVPAFNGYPTRDELSRRLGVPVHLENDANSAALGEYWQGAGQGVNDLVMLALGTGVGGGIISGGRILHGYVGMAAELGHITVVPNGNPCGCGGQGCLEKHASATAIAAMGRLLGLQPVDASANAASRELTSADVFELAEQGDPRAQAVFQSVGQSLGIALASLINIFNFPLYLIGGGASAAWDRFAPPMLAEVERRSLTYRLTKETTRIQRATLGADAGLYGAASLALR